MNKKINSGRPFQSRHGSDNFLARQSKKLACPSKVSGLRTLTYAETPAAK
jgi:hypothetical protein